MATLSQGRKLNEIIEDGQAGGQKFARTNPNRSTSVIEGTQYKSPQGEGFLCGPPAVKSRDLGASRENPTQVKVTIVLITLNPMIFILTPTALKRGENRGFTCSRLTNRHSLYPVVFRSVHFLLKLVAMNLTNHCTHTRQKP